MPLHWNVELFAQPPARGEAGKLVGVASWTVLPRVDDFVVLDEIEYRVRRIEWKAKSSMTMGEGVKSYNAEPTVRVEIEPTLLQTLECPADGKL